MDNEQPLPRRRSRVTFAAEDFIIEFPVRTSYSLSTCALYRCSYGLFADTWPSIITRRHTQKDESTRDESGRSSDQDQAMPGDPVAQGLDNLIQCDELSGAQPSIWHTL